MSSCPYCRQPLTEPSERFCPSCGGDLERAAPERSGTTPWDRRHEVGRLRAAIETTRAVLTGPTPFFRAYAARPRGRTALAYGVIVGHVALTVNAAYQVLGQAALRSDAGEGFHVPSAVAAFLFPSTGAIGLLVTALFAWVGAALGIAAWTLAVHALLRVMQAGARGLEATLGVVAYSQAAYVLTLLPVCGAPVGVAGWVVVTVIGLAEVHGTGRGRAAASVLLPLVACACWVVLVPLQAIEMLMAWAGRR